MDRIDLLVEVTPVDFKDLSSESKEVKSEIIRNRVIDVREIQLNRFSTSEIHSNALMSNKQLRAVCKISETSKNLLDKALKKLNLSARAYDRILKVSRTIADLDNQTDIQPLHVAEAIQYRSLDRENWGS